MTPPSELPQGIWKGKAAFWLGGLFLLLFALGTLAVRKDAAERSSLETLTPVPLDTRAPR